MKTVVLLLLALVPVASSSVPNAPQDGNIRLDKAKQIATEWLDSSFRGDTAVTTALSDVPFAFDRKRTIETISEVEEFLESMVQSKGERELNVLDVSIITDENEILNKAFPANYIVVFIQLDKGGDGVKLCVKPGDTFKVVGLSD